MSDRFPICLPFTLAQECPDPSDWSNPANFSDDPHDPGGATMCGILQSEYDKFREDQGEDTEPVVDISMSEGYEIYEDYYWEPRCSGLAPGFDLSYFDTCVNCGPTGSTKVLQEALGVSADGIWGPFTQAAVVRIADVPAAIRAFTAAREAYYRSLPGFVYFGHGWTNRTVSIGQDSLSMAGNNPRGVRQLRRFVKSAKAFRWPSKPTTVPRPMLS